MNIVVCDNIKDMAMQLHRQLDQQILEPDTTNEEMGRLLDAQQALSGAARFLMLAKGFKVEQLRSRKQE